MPSELHPLLAVPKLLPIAASHWTHCQCFIPTNADGFQSIYCWCNLLKWTECVHYNLPETLDCNRSESIAVSPIPTFLRKLHHYRSEWLIATDPSHPSEWTNCVHFNFLEGIPGPNRFYHKCPCVFVERIYLQVHYIGSITVSYETRARGDWRWDHRDAPDTAAPYLCIHPTPE